MLSLLDKIPQGKPLRISHCQAYRGFLLNILCKKKNIPKYFGFINNQKLISYIQGDY